MALRIGSDRTTQTDTAAQGAGTATVATSSGQLLASNQGRVELTICNTDASNAIFLALGVPAALNAGIRVPAGGSYSTGAYTGAVNAIAQTASVVVAFVEV